MNSFQGNRMKNSEKGIALVVALMMLLLITAALTGMIIMSNTETNVSANFRDEQTAFFSSKAGIEEVRDRMRAGATNGLSASIPTALPGAANGILYVTNPLNGETDTPWLTQSANYPDDEICKELTPCGSNLASGTYTSQSASTSYAATPILPWKWVRVMAKFNKSDTGATRVTSVDGTTDGYRVCWNGTNEVAVANTFASCAAANGNYQPVYELTALAVTPSGSRRMTQYEITRGAFPPFPGAMILDGTGADFSTNPHSNHLHASGTDAAQGPNAGSGCPAAVNQPAIGTTDAATATTVGGQLNDPGDFTGSPAGVAPVGTTLSSNPAMNLATVDGLTKLVNMITTAAGSNVYNTSNPAGINLGTDAAPVINVVNGDLAIGSGAGILLVTGTLTENGGSSFNGIILVIGKGSVTKNGGGGGQSNGSLFVANMYTDTTYAHLIALGSNLPPGPPTMSWNGGGNALMQYDSCWINAVTQSLPYTMVAQRALTY
jgi:Tfp pilus assembly protein PilX